MTAKAIRRYIVDVNWMRMFMLVGGFGIMSLFGVDPAFAFNELAGDIVDKAGQVAEAVKVILYASAVVSVLVGMAPMLWGEVKVKWIVSALVACTIISLMGALVNAFVTGG